jgi:hypothetical protein
MNAEISFGSRLSSEKPGLAVPPAAQELDLKMKLISAIAVCAALLLSAPSVAFARGEINIKPPVIDGPVIIIGRPDKPDTPDNKPHEEGDDFDNGGTDSEKTPNAPYPMVCVLDRNLADGEHVTVWFKNKGDTVIPKGAWIEVAYPDGTTKSYKLPADLAPLDAWGFWLPDGVWDFKGDFDCSVHVTAAP